MAAPATVIRGSATGRKMDGVGYLFVAFFAVPFLIFNILPVLFGAYVAFTEWSIIGTPNWVALDNFREAFGDEWARLAFWNILFYGLIIVPGVTVVGLFAALFVNKRYPFYAFARTMFFAPTVVSATVIGLVWVWMLDTQFGLVNQYLGFFGVSPIPWLTSIEWSLIGVSIASIWWDLGLAFVLFLAALQDIPRELTEAAVVDGATRPQRLRYVILPHVRAVLSMVITLQLISTLRIFSQVYVMTNGGPAGSSSSPIHYIYSVAIVRMEFGYASAVAIMLFAVIVVLTIAHRLLLRERA